MVDSLVWESTRTEDGLVNLLDQLCSNLNLIILATLAVAWSIY
jgi:hypothetical protein